MKTLFLLLPFFLLTGCCVKCLMDYDDINDYCGCQVQDNGYKGNGNHLIVKCGHDKYKGIEVTGYEHDLFKVGDTIKCK